MPPSAPVQYALPLDRNLPPRATMLAEDFMVSDSNREAALWILEREPSSWGGSALLVYGPESSGKTHLLNAWIARLQGAMFVCGDERLEDFINGSFAVPAIAVDDVDRIAGQASQEEWLQHLYNATRAAQVPLLLSARVASSAWGLGLKDIASRLNSCPAIALHEPDDELVRGLLMKLFSDRQLLVEDGVIEYLARRLDRTGAAICAAVAQLDQKSLEAQHKISIPFAQSIFETRA